MEMDCEERRTTRGDIKKGIKMDMMRETRCDVKRYNRKFQGEAGNRIKRLEACGGSIPF